MNLLIGGAVLLIVGSAIALVAGWGSSEETLIWTSVGASAAAGAALALAYFLSRRQTALTGLRSAERRLHPSAGEGAGTGSEQTGVKVAPIKRTAPRPSAKPAAPPSAQPAGQPAAATKPQAGKADEVVGIPERKKFHRPSCRYAQARGAEPMSRAAARRRGYDACGICKP